MKEKYVKLKAKQILFFVGKGEHFELGMEVYLFVKNLRLFLAYLKILTFNTKGQTDRQPVVTQESKPSLEKRTVKPCTVM